MMEDKLCFLQSSIDKLAFVTSEACKLADKYVRRCNFKFKLCGIGLIALSIGGIVAAREALALEDDISDLRKEIKRMKESDREE